MKKHGSKQKLQSDKDYDFFIASLTSATRGRLQELNKELFSRCKCVIFPLNDRWHWFLVVYKASEGVLKYLIPLKIHSKGKSQMFCEYDYDHILLW